MLFGLPWFAIVAIVAVGGGLIYAYKEKELEMEEKRMGSARELKELRQIVHNLKSRVETLEAASAERRSSPSDDTKSPLGEIEIEEEFKDTSEHTGTTSNIKNNLRN
ncbi:hypothetical protein [Gracilimonas tropica]|uniref:hypothetical protein n=1 Tax=Gracilimonas tropica TaxID=454600 RepID=UPI00035EAE6F|nr:hypothetical protein [Gracilimonas tropica]